MFPGELMLDVDQIAKCLKVSRGHIYNLASKERLPFKPDHRLGDRIVVSIVHLAKYLDDDVASISSKPMADGAVQVAQGKKKVGRPRGTTKARLECQLFQSSLRTAIYKFEANEVRVALRNTIEDIAFVEDGAWPCSDQILMFKSILGAQLSHAEVRFAEIDLETAPKTIHEASEDATRD